MAWAAGQKKNMTTITIWGRTSRYGSPLDENSYCFAIRSFN